LLTNIRSITVKNDGSTFLVLIRHERAVLKVTNERGLPLNARVGDLANFFRVELLPFLVIKFFIEGHDRPEVNKINKRVTHVAFVLEIDWKVEKIVCSSVPLVNSGEQHFLTILIRYVANHERGASVVREPNPLNR